MNGLEDVLLAKSVEEMTQEANAQLERLARRELGSLPHDIMVRSGDPAEEIVRVAETTESDLIILAVHDYKGLRRLFRGNTARRVEREAKCPVLILRGKDADQLEQTLWEEAQDESVATKV